MDMDRQLQNEAIYKPILVAIGETAKELVDRDWWRERLHEIGRWLKGVRWNGLGGWLQHVGMPLAAALAVLWLVGGRIWRRARRIWRRLRQAPRTPAGDAAAASISIAASRPFWRGRGWSAPPARRPANWPVAPPTASPPPGGRIAPNCPANSSTPIYRVRFGGLPLDNPQREAVEHGLAELERMA